MYFPYNPYPCPYYFCPTRYNPGNMNNVCNMYSYPYYRNEPMQNSSFPNQSTKQYNPPVNQSNNGPIILKDYGPAPFVVNIEEATKQNNNFRTALWTGNHLQLTLMSIPVGEDIGLEIHIDHDQFIRIEEGQGIVKMGDRKDRLYFQEKASDDYAIFIPAGTWHNLINTGNKPIKLYSIYAPPQHPKGTVHATKADAEAAE
ncbi:cupin domain-containing protein [Candidatus Formimonas warabiya]|uniref:Cupin n=1 Tax=Formimonas warabiya TaxID=1761012 RepID=A0A3G1KTL4_FORW1|nr:cupin domain-containing protein [Candidatus Formimonas warabiya]ATW25799.1 cupin [Candidatus Formimonas warabiya]